MSSHKQPLPVGSMINQCPTCRSLFTGMDTFDRHRTGAFGEPLNPRRCMTNAEMIAKGLQQPTHSGLWSRGVPLEAGGAALQSADEGHGVRG